MDSRGTTHARTLSSAMGAAEDSCARAASSGASASPEALARRWRPSCTMPCGRTTDAMISNRNSGRNNVASIPRQCGMPHVPCHLQSAASHRHQARVGSAAAAAGVRRERLLQRETLQEARQVRRHHRDARRDAHGACNWEPSVSVHSSNRFH